MARISLVEQYDNKDVIQQIYMLKTATDGWEERISATEQTANNALTTAEGFDARIDAVEDANTELNTKVDTFDTRIATAQTTADTAIGNVDTLDRQVTSRIADQEVTALDVASAGTGAYAVTAHKQNGNITSNSFNVSKVTSATIGEGSAQNSIYLQLNLSDGTTVRTNDTVISITGVEEDIHVTSIVLEDAPDAHTIKAIFTYNNGQSISSNTLTYDYPDIASSSSPGLVMGNDATGGVQVDGQGRMSVVGWADFATKTEVDTLTGRVDGIAGDYVSQAVFNNSVAAERTYTSEMLNELKTNLEGRIDSIEDELGAEGQAGTIRNDISLLKARDTTLQGNIDAVDARCDNISSTVSDHGTMLNAQAQSITENTAAIATKQDKLTFDTVPTQNSLNPVTSGGLFTFTRGMVKATDAVSYETGSEYVNMGSDGSWGVTLIGQVEGVPENGELFCTFNARLTSGSEAITDKGVTYVSATIHPDNRVEMVVRGQTSAGSTAFYVTGGYTVHARVSELDTALTGDATLMLQGWTYTQAMDTSSIGPLIFEWKATGDAGSIIVDTAISASSTNPVQNKVISAALDMKASTATTDALTQELADKQDKLTAGTGISIVDGVISVNLSNANGVSF